MSYKYLDLTGLSHFWDKIKAKFDSFSRNDLAVLQTKEYSGIYGSADDQEGASFYFASVRPDNWYKMWRVKYKVYATVPNQNNYHTYSLVEIYGNTTEVSYKIFNRILSTSYRPIMYHNVYRLTSTGYNNNYNHTLGIGLRGGANPTSSSYPRTIKIELLETENCTVTMFDSMIKRSAVSGQGTTNFTGISELDGCNNGLRETGDDNDTSQLRHNNGNYIGSTALYRYMLLLQKNETTLIPVNAVSNSTATTKTLTTEEFDPFGQLLYYNTTTTINQGSAIPASNLIQQTRFDLRYSFNTGTTLTTNKDVYIVAAPQANGKAKLHTTPITQTLPSSEDGLIYIYLGHAYSNYQIEMHSQHPIYQYKNGSLGLYVNASDKVDILGHSTVSRAVESAGYLKFAECDLSYGGYGNKYVVLFMTTEYGTNGKDGNGIVYINIRGNGTNASSVSNFYWLLNDDSTGIDTLYWAVNDHKIEFYRKVFAANEYAQVSFKVLHVGNFENAKHWEFKLLDVPFVEGTPLDTPIGEVHAIVSGGKVKNAETATTATTATKATQDASGNVITTTYATKSEIPTNYVTTNTTQTISGAKTLSSTLTMSNINNATYTTSTTGNIIPSATGLANPPWNKDLWHDHFALLRYHTIESKEVTNDGTTWNTSSLDINSMFLGKDSASVTVLAAANLAFRFVLKNTSFAYSGVSWFELGVAYTNPFSSFEVLIEFSTDKSTWTTCHKSTIASNSSPFFLKNNTSFTGDGYIRVTFTKKTELTTGTVRVGCLKALCIRKGDQGLGSEYEYPYDWDINSNLLPIANNTKNLGSNNQKWANVYATTFNGNATSATKATGDKNGADITTTYQTKLGTQTAYTSKGSATKVPQITTNTLGQVTGITEVTITQPTVNNGTLTIQKNGTNVQTFSANQSGNATANIVVPTKTSDLTNDSGFITNEHVTDVRINGTSILGNKVADIITNTAYNATTNKIATMADVESGGGIGSSNDTIENVVSLTKAEYDALQTKQIKTLYNITDDYDDNGPTAIPNSTFTINTGTLETNHSYKNGKAVNLNFTMKANTTAGQTLVLLTLPSGLYPTDSAVACFATVNGILANSWIRNQTGEICVVPASTLTNIEIKVITTYIV